MPSCVGGPGAAAPWLDLLVLTLSSTGSDGATRRDAARRTWARWDDSTPCTVRTIFLLGGARSAAVFEADGSLLRVSVREDYSLIGMRVLLGLEWVARHSPSRFVLKADDDTARFVGRPTHFLSHAWTYLLLGLVGALESFVARLPEGAPEPFFWFDCTSLAMPVVPPVFSLLSLSARCELDALCRLFSLCGCT